MAIIDNILAYWNLNDDGSGNVSLVDNTGNGYTLTNNNGVTLGTGIIGGGADFTDATQQLQSASVSLGLNSSLSFWYKGSTQPQAANLLSQYTGSWVVNFVGSSLGFYSNGNQEVFPISNSFDGNWHYYTVVNNAGNVSLWVDGATDGNIYNLGDLSSSTPFNIGMDETGDPAIIGIIDEIGIWNRALSESEVTSLYNGGIGRTYPFANLYYNNVNNNGNWGDLGNWWNDSAFTSPASALPDSTTLVFLYADVLENTAGDGTCYCYGAEFHSASFYSPLVLNSNGGLVNIFGSSVFGGTCTDGVSVHDSSSLGNNAVIQGNATFRDSSTNSYGTVDGNAFFYESSYNYGHILGNATVYYSGGLGNYPIGGLVDGTVSYVGWPAAQDQYFNDDVAGAGAAGNWQDLNNWWADNTFTTRPLNSVEQQLLPDSGTNIYVYANISAYNTSSAINVNRARFYNSAYLNTPITLNVSINVYFYNYSGNQSQIYGDCYFYNNSYFYTNTGTGFVTGNVYLYDNSGIYEDARTGANIASGGLYFYSLAAMKNTISYHFGGESDGCVFNIPSGGGNIISHLLHLPWFINI
jgi:Concanavalin A-like lectin/glucanases superfamily